MNNPIAGQKFKYFTFLWALVIYFEHFLNIHSFSTLIGQINILSILMIFRWSGVSLILFWASSLVYLFWGIRITHSHTFYIFLITFNVVVMLLFSIFNISDINRRREDIFKKIAPMIRLYVVGIYFFSFLAKINADFLNPEFSCASIMITFLQKNHPLLFGFSWEKLVMICATLAFEGSLPVLFIFKSTRPWAFCFGIMYHFLLGILSRIGPLPGFAKSIFSLLMLVLFFSFLDDAVFGYIASWVQKTKTALKRIVPTVFIRHLVITSSIYLPLCFTYFYAPQKFIYWKYVLLTIYAFIGFVYISGILRSHPYASKNTNDDRSLKKYFFPHPIYQISMGVLLLLNSLGPYLGIKTNTSLTMFSNLRTLGPQPNHYIFPSSMVIFKQDLVKIINSDNPIFRKYINNHFLLTAFEFRRIANQINGNFYVKCLYKGKVVTLSKTNGGHSDHPLLKPVSWAAQQLIDFGDVDELEHCRCEA